MTKPFLQMIAISMDAEDKEMFTRFKVLCAYHNSCIGQEVLRLIRKETQAVSVDENGHMMIKK